MTDTLFLLWTFLNTWFTRLKVPRKDVLGSYWPVGLQCEPLCLTDVEDDSVDIDRDVAWPADKLSVN